jgi:hypothetical protein
MEFNKMTLFVDFEEGLLLGNMDLFKKLKDLNNYLSCQKESFALPFNAPVISFIKDRYHKVPIVFIVKKENINEINKVLVDIVDNFEIQVSGCISVEDFHSQNHSVYIGPYNRSIAMNGEIEKIYVGSHPYVFLCWLFSKNASTISLGLGGLLYFPFVYATIVIPCLLCWTAWFNLKAMNIVRLSATFVSSVGFGSCLRIFRTLIELNHERLALQNDMEVLTGQEFIYSYSNVIIALLWLIVFFIFGLYGMTMSVFGGMIGLAGAFLDFMTLLSSFKTRWMILIPSFIVLSILSQPYFLIALFK